MSVSIRAVVRETLLYSYKKGFTEKPQSMQPASVPLVFGETPQGAPLPSLLVFHFLEIGIHYIIGVVFLGRSLLFSTARV